LEVTGPSSNPGPATKLIPNYFFGSVGIFRFIFSLLEFCAAASEVLDYSKEKRLIIERRMTISYFMQRRHHHQKLGLLWERAVGSLLVVYAISLTVGVNAVWSGYYTAKQLDAFEDRVGKTYWINSRQGKPPAFLSAPSQGASTVSPGETESFEIVELTGRGNDDPYYKVKFESGKLGYIRPETFLDQFNMTIVNADPLAEEKKKAETDSTEEKKRVAWINAQPWSPAVKQAAIKKQPTPGLNTTEVKQILGPPRHIRKLRSPLLAAEEQWLYPDGSVIVFNNGLLSRIEKTKQP
jgi:hypothetical protein